MFSRKREEKSNDDITDANDSVAGCGAVLQVDGGTPSRREVTKAPALPPAQCPGDHRWLKPYGASVKWGSGDGG
jgi:hypothetical protein